jgi:RNA polymerase sigma-70 factor (sigma-E family)
MRLLPSRGAGGHEATSRPFWRLWDVSTDIPRPGGHRDLLMADRRDQQVTRGATGPSRGRAAEAEAAVTALYQVHAVGLIRLALVLLGDRPTAEDVVQDAFGALYRRWAHLADTEKALSYVRSSILNGCRSELRRRIRIERRVAQQPVPADTASAEVTALIGEEHREVLGALRRLPRRQREALVLRFYLDLSEAEIAASMGISPGTVKSTTSRALSALGRLLEVNR